MSRRYLVYSAVAMAMLFASNSAYSQQAAPARYANALYIHVPAAKQAQFEEFYKTGDGMKAVKARMKDDPNITGISLRRVLLGNPTPRANYILLTSSNGTPATPDPAKRDAVYMAAVGTNYAGYVAKITAMSEVVGRTVSRIADSTANMGAEAGDVVVSYRLKTAPGKAAELRSLMRTYRLPLAADGVKEGRSKGWAFSSFSLSGGSALPYNATETRIFKNLDAALTFNEGSANGAMLRFTKLFPNKSYTGYQAELRELSTLVRTDTYTVVVSYRK